MVLSVQRGQSALVLGTDCDWSLVMTDSRIMLPPQAAAGETLPGGQPLVDLGEVLDGGGALRALPFDESQHALLSEELKHLYTAITRAKNNGARTMVLAERAAGRLEGAANL